MEPNLIRGRLERMQRDQLIHELEHAHSEEFVVMFLGYLMHYMHKVKRIDLDQEALLDAWQIFKAEMGKKGMR